MIYPKGEFPQQPRLVESIIVPAQEALLFELDNLNGILYPSGHDNLYMNENSCNNIANKYSSQFLKYQT